VEKGLEERLGTEVEDDQIEHGIQSGSRRPVACWPRDLVARVEGMKRAN
jgi:hypothetical protein